jgi:hypothetical protein
VERRDAVTIDFAGGPYRIDGLTSAQAELLRAHFGALVVGGEGGGAPAVTAIVEPLARDDHAPADTRGWEYALDFDYRPDRVRFAGWGLVGELDAPVTRGTLATTADASDRFVGVVENFFRVVVAYRLVECGGALLHSAGIVDGSGARVFFGASGAGKTTLCAHGAATGREVLSDELNALWPTERGVVVEKLPFAGDFGGAAGARAAFPALGLYRIAHAARTRLSPLTPAEALGALVAASPFVNADRHRNARLLRALGELAAAIPVRALGIALHESVWDILS